MSERIKVDFGMPLAVIGTLACLVIWGFSNNRRLDALETRLNHLQITVQQDATGAYLPRWTTNNTLTNNAKP